MTKTRLLIACAILLLAVPVLAQQPSVTFMPLATSPQFQNRVTFNVVTAAPAIELELQAYTPAGGDSHPSTPLYHSYRVQLASAVARNPSSYTPIFAVHLATNGAVTGAGALTGSVGAGTLDTPATDGALFSAINAIWSTVAGCVTNP